MAEPGTWAAVGTGVAGLAVAPLVPGIDLNAVIGAFAGALFFVLWAKDLTAWARVGYLLVSWIGGYYMAGEAVGRAWTAYSGLPALISAALIVTMLIGALEWMMGGKTPAWIRIAIGRVVSVFGGPKDGTGNGG